jgi:hypothetical protein
MKKTFALTLALAVMLGSAPAYSQFRGLVDKATGADKCRDDDQSCKNRAALKGAAATVAIGIAAKLIYDMVIDAKSEEVNDEDSVIKEYTKEHKSLPAVPTARDYSVNAFPGNVVKPVSDVKMRSQMTVVPAATRKEMLVEERITIYDNEDNTKALRISSKIVNENTKRGGRFKNEFSFAFPEGIPQGMYPITTELLLDGKPVETEKNDMQLVMVVDAVGNYRVASLPAVNQSF